MAPLIKTLTRKKLGEIAAQAGITIHMGVMGVAFTWCGISKRFAIMGGNTPVYVNGGWGNVTCRSCQNRHRLGSPAPVVRHIVDEERKRSGISVRWGF
jgi:hypothetical protein